MSLLERLVRLWIDILDEPNPGLDAMGAEPHEKWCIAHDGRLRAVETAIRGELDLLDVIRDPTWREDWCAVISAERA